MEKGYNVKEARNCIDQYIKMEEGGEGVWSVTKQMDAFHAIITKDDAGKFYLIVRGTKPSSVKDLIVDAAVFKKPKFPFPIHSDLDPAISSGIKVGFQVLVDELRVFLNALPKGTDLYITGHSQGAAACGIFHLWLETFIPNKFNIKTYAFAPPTIGNQDFATMIDRTAEFGYYRVINPLDLIPYAYANLDEAMEDNIPTPVPFRFKILFHLVNFILKRLGRKFVPVGETITLPYVPLETCDKGARRLVFYECNVIAQHVATNYKTLIDMQEE
ncbi:MAG: hypothetical protein S4CHLAM20_05000 [Chlamydiia bacterium]|nr:hypothetical protein [Chlamydiia bacterium]